MTKVIVIMNIAQFEKEIKPLLNRYTMQYATFVYGDFGSLERIELEGFNKLATVNFWSKGWIGIDIYDCACDEQVMNILLSPEDKHRIPLELDKFLTLLNQTK